MSAPSQAAPAAASVRRFTPGQKRSLPHSRGRSPRNVAADKIRVNVLSPGVIATDMQDRVSTPGQIAGAGRDDPDGPGRYERRMRWHCLYLCSAEASGYITGQVIEVNGGLLMP